MIVNEIDAFFQRTGTHVHDFYQHYIVSGLRSDKKKLVGIGSAILLIILARFYRRVAVPPKALRAIPRVNFFSYMKSVLSHEDAIKQLRTLYAPLIAKGDGVYVV